MALLLLGGRQVNETVFAKAVPRSYVRSPRMEGVLENLFARGSAS